MNAAMPVETIPYGRQDITEEDLREVIDVLRSDYLTQGPMVPAFESSIKQYVGVKHALAMNSATSALHAACVALGVGQGDWVWTSPITFVASANCALYCGARVDFVDIDPRTYNLSVESLEEKLKQAKQSNRLPKVVIAVHLCGQSCDMAGIRRLAREYGFRIIEDASHAIGGKYRGKPIGCCEYSDIVIFSFHPVKIITTAEGGMAVTNDPELASIMSRFRTHGITTQAELFDPRDPGEIWNYQQIELGFNYRMTDLQAALGVSQMKRLDHYVQMRHHIAQRYDRELKILPVQLPYQSEDIYSSYHLYPILVGADLDGKSQRGLYDHLRSKGILANLHYIPVYRQPFYQRMCFKLGYCPNAEDYFRRTVSIPMFATLRNEQQARVIKEVVGYFG